tara:strand:+ start:2146 stop:2814 length:669 start_codon:yes stop_codon:yes gene_type:complete
MATTNAHESRTETKNDGSTIPNAGNVASNAKVYAPGLGVSVGVAQKIDTGPKEQTGSAGTVSTVNHVDAPTATKYRPGLEGRQTAKGSGAFAYNKAGEFIVLGATSKINNVSNTSLSTTGSYKGQFRGTIHSLESYRTIPSYTFNEDGSRVTIASAGGSSTNYTDSAGDGSAASADSAASPTRAIPGALVYTDHALARTGDLAIPVTRADGSVGADYKPKTG